MFKGVNLGGWLVLEPWMTPYLFPSVEDYDETRLSTETEPEQLREMLREHRRSWIRREDFSRIRDLGLELVRIPYPWWVFGDAEPYLGCIEFLDEAMDWAADVGLSVMLDLHTAPGCQNGFDNGGIRGVVDWPKDRANIDLTVEILVRVAKRYAGHRALHSFGILNEPIGSIDLDLVKDFYLDAERALRPVLGDLPFVYHDSFRADAWGSFFRDNGFGPMFFDVHLYQCFVQEDLQAPLTSHVEKSRVWRRDFLVNLGRDYEVIVGEWSLGLPKDLINGMDDAARDEATRNYADAQLQGMRDCAGWIFWSWKVADADSGWNFEQLARKGIIDIRSMGRGLENGNRGRRQPAS